MIVRVLWKRISLFKRIVIKEKKTGGRTFLTDIRFLNSSLLLPDGELRKRTRSRGVKSPTKGGVMR